MCGIFGAVSLRGNLCFRQQDFIKSATTTGQVRGVDGTGWIVVDAKKGAHVYKRAVKGSDFLDTDVGKKASTALGTAIAVIGHNRKTTSGSDTDNDCHPFSYKTVVGVHNGGIPPHVLKRVDTADAVAAVDSAEIYAALNKVSNPIEVLSKLHMGSYCLVWIDKVKGDLCIARNKERPMWAASGDEGLYFASEPGMLFWLMSRYNLQAKDSKLFELNDKHLYRIPLKNPANISRTSYDTTYPTYPVSNRGRYNNGNWNQGYYAGTQATHKYVSNADILASSYPALRHISDVIISNCDIIKRQEEAKKSKIVPEKHLDVVVTNVSSSANNKNYPDVVGYVYDETNSDITIPIQLLGVKDDGYDFLKRYTAAVKKEQLFTLRGVVRNIRVCADGAVSLAMGIINVWDDEANEPITEDSQLYALEVDDAVGEKYSRFTSLQLSKMWSKLEEKTTSESTVH